MIKGLLMQLNQVTKMVMPYIRIKKLIITLVKKIHTEHIMEMVQAIISCFEKQDGKLYYRETEAEKNVYSDHGECI